MQFCSADCVGAYQRRLDEATIHKVNCLEGKLGGPRTVAAFGGNVKKEAAECNLQRQLALAFRRPTMKKSVSPLGTLLL
jgi:hypothetical protein